MVCQKGNFLEEPYVAYHRAPWSGILPKGTLLGRHLPLSIENTQEQCKNFTFLFSVKSWIHSTSSTRFYFHAMFLCLFDHPTRYPDLHLRSTPPHGLPLAHSSRKHRVQSLFWVAPRRGVKKVIKASQMNCVAKGWLPPFSPFPNQISVQLLREGKNISVYEARLEHQEFRQGF